jgi:hypothetical protein
MFGEITAFDSESHEMQNTMCGNVQFFYAKQVALDLKAINTP